MDEKIKHQKYRAEVAYIGSAYKGFQFQKNGDSIQAQLERALSILFRHPVTVRGASRTDSGVHAEKQVISFSTPTSFIGSDWRYNLNAILPRDICIREISMISDDFDPINDSIGKIYRYRILRGLCTLPHLRDMVWSVNREMDLKNIQSEAVHFLGTHDFTSFCSIDSDARTKVREIFEIKVDVREPLVDVWICGRGFLKQMVRIIVGTLVDVANKKIPVGSIPRILDAKQRDLAGQTAPPQGLTLVEVLYDEIPNLENVIKEASRGYCLKI